MRTETRTVYIAEDGEEFYDEHEAAVYELAEHLHSAVSHGSYMERWRAKMLAEWLLQHYDMRRIEANEVEPRPDEHQVIEVVGDPTEAVNPI